MDTIEMLRLLNQQSGLLDPLLITRLPSSHLNDLITNQRSEDLTFVNERLIQPALFSQRTSNQQILIRSFNALSDAQRMTLFQDVALRITAGTRSLTTTQIAQFIDAFQQQSVPHPMPSSGLNAEKLADKDIEIPSEYCCSLSLSIMTDPVYLLNDPTEARFERDWITKWLTEHGSHPASRGEYLPSALRSDIALKARIDEFVQSSEAVITNSPSK